MLLRTVRHDGAQYHIRCNFISERWKWILLGLLVVLTAYHSYSTLQLRCRGEVSELKESLEQISSELAALAARHGRLLATVRRSPWLMNGSSPHHPLSVAVIPFDNGPPVEYETLRRRVYFNTKELWYYVSERLRTALQETFDGQTLITASMVEGVAERKRWLLSLQEQLPLADGREQWRRQEAASVSDLVLRRLQHLQHPSDCWRARKLVCPYEWKCGFGCDIHYLASCLISAYATQRILILRNDKWKYYGKEKDRGWDYVFRPLSDTCTKNYNDTYVIRITGRTAAERNAKVLYFPTAFYRRNLGYGVPIHYVPQDLARRIVRFTSDPSAWWVGQILKYMLKPQHHIKKFIVDAFEDINITSPLVGVHIRRTDKLEREASLHSLEEYMSKVEDYYVQLEQTTAVNVRRVYLATDDTEVIEEAVLKYPQYKFYSNYSRAQEARPETRYTMQALTGLLVDIYVLTMCDYVVCTLSSNIARTIYELMHIHHIDVSNRFFSLDFTYYYYRTDPLRRFAVMRNADIAFDIGDVIASKYWNHTTDGTVLSTRISGRIPWYKTEEQLALYPYPEYKQLPIYRDEGDSDSEYD